MNTIDARRNKIVEYVNNKGSVGIEELCKQLNVSEMTVRRDLNMLDRQGLLKRIHGGATANLGRSYEPPLFLRSMANVESKKKLGQLQQNMFTMVVVLFWILEQLLLQSFQTCLENTILQLSLPA